VFLTLKSILNNEAKGKVRNCNTLVCGFTIGSAGNHEWLVEENLNQLLMGEDLRVRKKERLTLAEETIFLCREVQQGYVLVLVG
jgi:hypothetical protein